MSNPADDSAPFMRRRTLPPDPPACVPTPDDPHEIKALEILHAFTEANPPETE